MTETNALTEAELDAEMDASNKAFNSLDFKKLFAGVFKISEEMLGKDAPEDWTGEGRAEKLSTFSDFLDTLQEAVPGMVTKNVKEGFAEAIEELHPTDNV